MTYRTFGITVTPHGGQKYLVQSQRSGKARLLSLHEACLLPACDTFRSLHDHAARTWEMVKTMAYASEAGTEHAGQSDYSMASVERQLQGFVEDGFLVSEADLYEEVRTLCRQTKDVEEAVHTITSIGIPTRDRPESVRRALASYIENTTRFERTPSFTVIDDSRKAATQALTKKGLRTLQRRYGVRIRYANREQRARFSDELARRAGISEDLVRFALLGDDRCDKTYGGCRNALLLDSAGEVTIQVDDDTVCRLAAAPDVKAGLVLTSKAEVNELWFFEHPQDAVAFTSPVDADLLGIHEQLLGRPLTACIATVEAAGEILDFREMELRFLDNMQVPGAKVAVSFVGTVGDSGAQYSFRFLRIGNTYDRLTETEQAYRSGLTTRQMIKVATRPSISDGAYGMTTNIGLDHRTLLPPFMPVLRNEDGIFGSVLSAFFPELYTGYLPYTVLHSPPESRSSTPDAPERRYTTFITNTLLMWVILSFRSHPVSPDPAQDMRALGGYLRDLGALSQDDVADLLRTVVSRVLTINEAYAKRRLKEKSDAPAYWKDDVQAYLLAVQKAVKHSRFFIPSDLEGSDSERLALFQDLVCQFGKLLVHWPDIVAAAKDLRAKGRRLASPL